LKVFGDIDLNQNYLKNVALQEVDVYPTSPVVGEFCFKEKIVSMCVSVVDGIPTWIPLTNELMSYVHTQSVASTTWTVNHNLGKDVIIQIIDGDGLVLIPDEIENTSPNQATVTFSNAQVGRAICVSAESSGSIHSVTAYIHEQTEELAIWSIQHNLGYQPLVQVVLSDGFQIIPSEIEHISENLVEVRFTDVQTGKARLI
jgi:hypothetical protein